jgi:hypothetical protein
MIDEITLSKMISKLSKVTTLKGVYKSLLRSWIPFADDLPTCFAKFIYANFYIDILFIFIIITCHVFFMES